MNVIKTINLNSLVLLWLDKTTSIANLAPPATLTADERIKAESIKSDARRNEFERSRLLLRSQTGAQTSFLPDSENSPGWPSGLRGSISHKNGHVVVCTDRADKFFSIGIDSENAEKNISHLQEKICTTNDLKLIDNICRDRMFERGSLVALFFSAKEALFKCHFPLEKRMFWFHDAEVCRIDFESGEIDIKVLIDTSASTKEGHVTKGKFILHNASDSGYWITAFSLPR